MNLVKRNIPALTQTRGLAKALALAGVLASGIAACSSESTSGNKGGSGGSASDGAAGGAGGGTDAGSPKDAASSGGMDGGVAGSAGGGDAADALRGGDTGGVAGSGGTGDAGTVSDAALPYPSVACTGVVDKMKPLPPAAGRKVYCAIDLGSNNAKLQVISLEDGKPLSFKDERQCRTRLGFGAKVFANNMAMPLPAADIRNLIEVVNELKAICALDQGTLVGTEATQWARDATNIDDIKSMVTSATGQTIEVLSGAQEGQYGYVAATRNAPERFSLDPGSNSFQIGWLAKGATNIQTVSVPFGYVRGAGMYYAKDATDTYDQARAKHAMALKTMLDAELAKLSPPSSLAMLKAAITAGNLKPEIFVVGQDGATHLGVRGLLKDTMGKWIDTSAAYTARVNLETLMMNATYGDITTLLTPTELAKWFTDFKADDFMTLRNDPVRGLYGEKLLANTVLLDTLRTELGLTTHVLVPQEMPVGYILAKIK